MDELERDYLKQQLQQLERSNRRWKLVTLVLGVVLASYLIVGGASSLVFVRRQEMLLQMEQARAAEEAARRAAEQLALDQAQEARQKQEKANLSKKGEERGATGEPAIDKAGKDK